MSDFEYEIDEGRVTITGYTGKDRDVVIPDEIEGLPVTRIGSYAFQYCALGLTSITLPNSITTIGDRAFQDCNADITIRRDTAQKKLHAIFALVEAHRHYTDPEAAHIMCEKIMELKEDAE